jgi:hypothetical protein
MASQILLGAELRNLNAGVIEMYWDLIELVRRGNTENSFYGYDG